MTRESSTRRKILKYGGTVVGSGLLAGCLSGISDDAAGGTDTAGSSGNDDGSAGGSNDGSDSNASGHTGSNVESYTASISPVGTVEFESVPESAFIVNAQYADMAIAFGHGDAVNTLFSPEFLGKTMNNYYDRLDGVSFDWKGLADPLGSGMSKELFYKLSSDVHFVDPAWVSTQKGWDQDDIEEIRTNIGPWFGNHYSGPHSKPPKRYRNEYQYYSLWEITEKVGQVFKEQARYNALEKVHVDLLSTIQSNLPPKDERPTATRVTFGDDVFYTYHLNEPGFWMADTRPLKATDAFAELTWGGQSGWGTIGYEALLETDPDVILHLWGLSPGYNIDEITKTIKNHPIGRQLSAIQNDRFYPSGIRRQGPIVNLFQLEMTAKQLYPDQFGEWPDYNTGESYPKIPKDEQLFDRQRVADIVNGKLN